MGHRTDTALLPLPRRRLVLAVALILVAALTGSRAQSDSPLTIVATSDSGLELDFTLPDLHEAVDLLGETVLFFDGAELPHSHVADDEPPPTGARLPYVAELLGMPPDATATVVASSVVRGSLAPETFPSLTAALRSAEPTSRPFATIDVLGYARNQYVASIKVFPVAWNGSVLRVTRKARLSVRFASPARAPAFREAVTKDSTAYERYYADLLLNAPQAAGWRYRQRGAPAPRRVQDEPASGRVRLEVRRTGLYKVTPADLRAAGFTTEDIDPSTFDVIFRGESVGADVIGVDDGVFSGTDVIVFYGEEITRDRFTNLNAYGLEWGRGQGVRPGLKNGALVTEDAQRPRAFRAPAYREIDRLHDTLPDVTGERVDHYFWTGFTGGSRNPARVEKLQPVDFPTEANQLPRDAILRIAMQGTGPPSAKHVMQLAVNGRAVGPRTWTGQTSHFAQIAFPQSYIAANTGLTLTCLDENGTPDDKFDVYMDWFEFDYWRNMQYDPKQRSVLISSQTFPEVTDGPAQFHLTDFNTPNVLAYELGPWGIIARIDGVVAERQENTRYTIAFEDVHTVPTRYIVAPRVSLLRPVVRPAPFAGLMSPAHEVDYLIITHADFRDAIQELADYRQGQGLDVMIVDVEAIYDEFNHGLFSPFAIQAFLRFAFQVWAQPPTYVLLVGDGHYGYKGGATASYEQQGVEVDFYPNFVPTIHAWTRPFGETAIDQRFVNVHGDDILPDMFLGRLPVQRPGELSEVIDKIIAYERDESTGPWQARLVQVSDDDLTNSGDRIFQTSREELIRGTIQPAYEVDRIYLKEIGSAGRTKERIKDAIRDGALILEYAGHGGRGVWADEDILRLPDLQGLRNGRRQPLVVATTCDMNFFDRPERFGQRAIGEEFILGRTRGAIATIGATRETFAICNAQFDPHFFEVFLNNPDASLGVAGLLAAAKTSFVTAEIIPTCAAGVEQYVLFGDPALRLLRPSLEVNVNVTPVAVKPGQQIRLLQDAIVEPGAPAEKAGDFDGDLAVTVTYPNNFDFDDANDLSPQTSRKSVVGGEFGDVLFTVPAGVVPGEGVVRVYARSPDASAIGGVRFSVRQPRVVNVEHRIQGQSLTVSADVVSPDGLPGIKEVVVRSVETSTFSRRNTPMRHTGNMHFVITEPIPLPGLGKRIEYTIEVKDAADQEIASTLYTFTMPLGPDLAIVERGGTRVADIRYLFDQDLDRWVVEAVAANFGDERSDGPVDVVLIEGNGDVDGNWILDDDAQILARATISVAQWGPGDADNEEFERAPVHLVLAEPLSSGLHDLVVWIDPARVAGAVLGDVEESGEFNNRSRRSLEVSAFLVGVRETLAHSLDRAFRMTVPAGAADPTSLSIAVVEPPSEPGTLDAAEAPFGAVPLLRLSGARGTAFDADLQSGQDLLREPATLQVSFDLIELEADLAADSELSRNPADRTNAEARHVASRLETTLGRSSIYHWLEDRKAWRRLDSELLVDASGEPEMSTVITQVLSNSAANRGLRITTASVDPTVTPVGGWAVLFVSETEYLVLHRPVGAATYQQLRERGRIAEPYADLTVGLRALLVNNHDPSVSTDDIPDPPEIGDVITFETGPTEEGLVVVRRRRSANVGDGTAEVALLDFDGAADPPIGDWIIMITAPDRYELRDGRGDVVLDNAGRPIGGVVDGTGLVLAALGLRLTVFAGEELFRFGDSFRFRIGEAATIQAATTRTGTFMLLWDRDAEPPTIQLWVDDVVPFYGAVIPPRPTIAMLLSDGNGIDVDTLRYEVKEVGTGLFVRVSEEEYVLNPEPIGQVSLTHRPILFIGTYVLRLRVSDLAGTPLLGSDGNPLLYVFAVEEDPDLESPVLTLVSEQATILDGDVLHEAVEQVTLVVRDGSALDVDTLTIAMAFDGGEPEPVERYELDFDKTVPDIARATWSIPTDNGAYDFYAQMTDTSTNVGFLGADETTPLSFELDAPVHFVSQVLNAPNPFDPLDPMTSGTFFAYELTQPADRITIKIYTVAGRLVRVLDEAYSARGYGETHWDGRDENGHLLANGTYFFKVRMESTHRGEKHIENQIGRLAILR